ncbi:hypothetical protein [Allorhodopirellula solitaria]|uniref:Uncharacterized protein n=1 Tax=Allorhodopirellula solitaria TaxID=2527987 RepID=A0A5C5YIW0_9BACT|nr:hypothetical protein [Allorhodopirellula solitaria]TWT74803.1 hypothetical protein CA85_00890 [Allorhodopirellula solitaria]
MPDENHANEQRQREIAVLLARGLSRAARTCEQTVPTEPNVDVGSHDDELVATEGGER